MSELSTLFLVWTAVYAGPPVAAAFYTVLRDLCRTAGEAAAELGRMTDEEREAAERDLEAMRAIEIRRREAMIEIVVRVARADGRITQEEWEQIHDAVPEELKPTLHAIARRCAETSYVLLEDAPEVGYRGSGRAASRVDTATLEADLAALARELPGDNRRRVRTAALAVIDAGLDDRDPALLDPVRDVVTRAL